jgi:hypothetical protein
MAYFGYSVLVLNLLWKDALLEKTFHLVYYFMKNDDYENLAYYVSHYIPIHRIVLYSN